MIKIIKYGCEFNLPKKCITTVDAAYDGVRVILNDNTEIRFQMNVSNQIKALIPIAKTSTADVVVLNLDNAIAGQYDKVLMMEMKQANNALVNTVSNTVKADPPAQPVVQKKKGGRPKKVTK